MQKQEKGGVWESKSCKKTGEKKEHLLAEIIL